jgi:hypothetical protein
MDVILCCKAFRVKIIFVLIETPDKVVGYTDIKAYICSVCKNINIHTENSCLAAHQSIPLKAGADFADGVERADRAHHAVRVRAIQREAHAVADAVAAGHRLVIAVQPVRELLCRRYAMERSIERVRLADGTEIRRKVASGYGVRRAKWEADDMAAYAVKHAIPLSEAQRRVLQGQT